MSTQEKTAEQQAALAAARRAAYAAVAAHEHDMATNPAYKVVADRQMKRREAAAVKAGRNVMLKAPAIPRVLLNRDRNEGEEATQAWAVVEARYVIEMIQEGSSTYSDDPDGGKGALRACKQYLKRCGA
ncbi:hypothetical protein LPN04_31115 [Rugamonas sp. A1-17]|nr:hypothetical protein [Rugamonas sp. A1-17]